MSFVQGGCDNTTQWMYLEIFSVGFTACCGLSHHGLIVFPLLFQLGHECLEAFILSKIIQIVICFEQNIAGESIISRGFQPLNCLFAPVHECVRASYVIRGMVEVSESLSTLNGQLDFLLGYTLPP